MSTDAGRARVFSTVDSGLYQQSRRGGWFRGFHQELLHESPASTHPGGWFRGSEIGSHHQRQVGEESLSVDMNSATCWPLIQCSSGCQQSSFSFISRAWQHAMRLCPGEMGDRQRKGGGNRGCMARRRQPLGLLCGNECIGCIGQGHWESGRQGRWSRSRVSASGGQPLTYRSTCVR